MSAWWACRTRSVRTWILVLVAGLVLVGCSSRQPDVGVIDAAVSGASISRDVDAGFDAGTALPDGGTHGALSIQLVVEFDGGSELFDGGQIAAATALTLRFPALKDARVRLLDWADAIVPSDDVATANDAGLLDYRISVLAPLKTGRAYSIELDSQSGGALTDASGGTWDDLTIPLRVRGELESDPPAAKTKLKKKRK